ncbi:MAG: OmpH family outer membrane protein [Alphaproteobacteria bacterium]|nr:OmpH family outer membrane protein [Alphaproteobacteria bacterium]
MPLAYAANAAPLSIGVVDVRYILSQSLAAVSIEDQQRALKDKFLSEISEREKALRDEEQALAESKNTLSSEEYAQRRKDYEQKFLELGRETREKKRALDEISTNAANQLRDALTQVVQEIANESGFNLIISNQNVITGAKDLDITARVLERLNTVLPRVELVNPLASSDSQERPVQKDPKEP